MAYAAVFVASIVGLPSTTRAQRAAPAPAAETKPIACDEFAGLSIPASVTPLATTGAKVTSATAQPASGTGARVVGAFCRIMVEIAPVDPKAPPINYFLSADGLLMPMRKGQPTPDLRYFQETRAGSPTRACPQWASFRSLASGCPVQCSS
jgi:hypothetical protein